MFLELVLASALGTLAAGLFIIYLIYAIVVSKRGDIEDKVDEKVEEKAGEMMGGLFQ